MSASVELSYDTLVRQATAEALDSLEGDESPSEIECLVMQATAAVIRERNALAPKGEKWEIPKQMSLGQIAEAILKTHCVCRIAASDTSFNPDYDLLGLYVDDPDDPAWGTYVSDYTHFRRIASEFCYSLSDRAFNDLLGRLRCAAPRRMRESHPDLICVGNGIFNYATKELEPYDPAHVFLSKTAIDYDPCATEPEIEMPDGEIWTPTSWMAGLSDDPQIVNLLWEITSALLRPNVRMNKNIWLHSESGNNGKGTLCEMWRNILGAGNYASIPIADFSKDFMLEPLIHSNAIIVDENDVGTFIDHTANLKAVITNDVLTINRKYKDPIVFRFRGLMVQCLNEYPKIKDKSESFYRRQLVVPMTKCFTGHTREYIKSDYLHRPEVLRFIVKHALEGSFYEFTEPDVCKHTLDDYKEFNDPLRQFWAFFEAHGGTSWTLYPFTYLYELYRAWLPRNVPGSTALGQRRFIDAVVTLCATSPKWECRSKSRLVRSKGRMDGPEPLTAEFDLSRKHWGDAAYSGVDPNRAVTPTNLAASYRGITKR